MAQAGVGGQGAKRSEIKVDSFTTVR
jgi:hypothetical protein